MVAWWNKYSNKAIDLYRVNSSEQIVLRVAGQLSTHGVLYTWTEEDFAGGLDLLVRHLRGLRTPPRDILLERILAYANRPRPYLPELSNLGEALRYAEDARSPEPLYAWIDPMRILLKEPGTKSFIHYSPDELVDFACRVAAERGDPRGLCHLLGNPGDGVAHVHVQGWAVHADEIFRIRVNGNHRLTVLAALGVPCVLAENREHDRAIRDTATDCRTAGSSNRLVPPALAYIRCGHV